MGEHENTGVYRGIHGCTYIRTQGFTVVYMGEHKNTGVYRSIHG